MSDPLEPLFLLRRRMDQLDQARSTADCLARTCALLDGLLPGEALLASTIYLYRPAKRAFEIGEGVPASPLEVTAELLQWAAARGEVSSVPVDKAPPGLPALKSILLAPVPGQFKAVGVLAVGSSRDVGTLDRTQVLLLDLLTRDLGRVLENLRVYEQMQRLRQLLDNIVESVPQGILAVGLDDTVIACNRNSELLFGLQRIDVLEAPYREALPKPLAQLLSSLIVALLEEGQARDAEYKRESSKENALPIGISTTLLRDKEGKPQGFLFICRDLTLTMEVQKLRDLDRMKSEFVHTVSHELKTPLTAVLGGAEVLLSEKENLTPDQQEMVGIIDQGGKRLHSLIMDLLDLSRLESGKIGLERAETDLGAQVREALENVRHKNPKCQVTVDIAEDLPLVMADGDKLTQVFENFIGNALKYSPAGGDVTVRLALEGERIRFAVSDQGIGIAPEHIPMLFEKFYRVDSSTTAKIEGTGLGLAIVKHIIELHEGEVTVESAVGKGSTFGFYIPLILPAT